jgi:methenyltetrahydromethanopterin cyclohydrolase
MKLKFSQHIFEKYSNIKFDEKLSSGSRVVPCGQTDGSDEANSRFSQICERAEN